MYKCELCGTRVTLSEVSVCCFCRHTLCATHQSIENHDCLYLPYVSDLQERRNLEPPKSRKLQTLLLLGILLFIGVLVISTSYPLSYEVPLRDPTYREALQFITIDLTDNNEYIPMEYTCVNFATDFKSSALKAGYRCGIVLIYFPATGHLTNLPDRPERITNWSHAINCFNTTDGGLLFIEPQTDDIVRLTCGEPYWDRTRYGLPSYNDTIADFQVIW